MTNNLTFDSAYLELKKLVAEIEDDEMQLDTLAAKVNDANHLIKFCENALRTIDNDTAALRQ